MDPWEKGMKGRVWHPEKRTFTPLGERRQRKASRPDAVCTGQTCRICGLLKRKVSLFRKASIDRKA